MKNYITGFLLSIALTLTAFLLVMQRLLVGSTLVLAILALAIIQLWVQLIFFLHLDIEKGPRWNLAIFLSTLGIVLLLVVGSLVIMQNLNYRMSAQQMNQYILNQSGGF